MNRIIFLSIILSFFSCKNEEPFPKPKSFLRVDLPEHSYVQFSDDCNFKFEVSSMAKVIDKPNSTCFKNIIYPKYKASVYCTYIALDSNLFSYTEYSRKLAYEHTIKANGIEEVVYSDTAKNVFGTSFNIRGNVACNYLFYLTDSSSNYFAGSLYFENVPNYDSLQPVLEYIVEDVEHLINTFEWK